MKIVILMKKEGVFRSYLHLRTKTLEKFKEGNDKNALDWMGRKRTVKKCLKRLEKYEEHMRKDFLKHLMTKFRSVKNKPRLIEK